MLEELQLHCPYCGEAFTTLVDGSGGEARYIEDCPICCRPIEMRVTTDSAGGLTGVETRRDDD